MMQDPLNNLAVNTLALSTRLPAEPVLPPPQHVAIIMDGNGRWAEARGLPRVAGHRAGVDAVRRTVKAALELGVGYLTIYSFSTENWTRPPTEVMFLMGLIRRFIQQDLADMHAAGVRIRIIGERDRVDTDLLALMDDAVITTSQNTALNLNICFNYGARGELAKAARRLAEEVAAGRLTPDAITPERLEAALDTFGMPDPDLMIRTSGEVRVSNFLLWQLAYTEFVFLDANWPDFNKDMLEQAIRQFQMRSRRFGGLAAVASR
jgi:undecaprenyl diphosphate synthase